MTDATVELIETFELEPVEERVSALDRTIDLATISWQAISWVVVMLAAGALRLVQLGDAPLSAVEARLAFEGYSVFRGATNGPYQQISETNPAALLLRTLTTFLFGDGDGSARLPSALLGIGLVALVFAIRRELGPYRALAAATLVALSPTLIFGSRTANDAQVGLFFGMLTVVALIKIGAPDRPTIEGAAVLLGFALAAAVASGPATISLLVAIGVGIILSGVGGGRSGDAFRVALMRLGGEPRALIAMAASALLTLVALVTRLFSDPDAIAGLGTELADWGRLIFSDATTTPTQFFLLAILLYEIVAVVLAVTVVVVGSSPTAERRSVDWLLPAGWFIGAFVLFSFSAGRAPEHTVFVAFPLLLLAGMGLGDVVERFLAGRDDTPALVGFLFATLGVVVALIAVLILIGRIDTAVSRSNAVVQVLAAALIALAPLIVVAISLGDRIAKVDGVRPVNATILLAVALVLGLIGFRSAVELSFYQGDTGRELLAQRTSTAGTREIAQRFDNLSRDLTAGDRTPENPEGGRGLTIALDERVQWPYRWYFRDYPNLAVVAGGQAPDSEADVLIAPDDAGMTDGGYQPRLVSVTNRVPSSYTAPSIGSVLKHIVVPSYWQEGLDYLLYRRLDDPAEPETVAFGYSGQVARQVSTDTGPFSLYERVGPGTGRGQFLEPRGIAINADGTRTYVVDSLNGRIEVFDETGVLVAIWGDADEGDELTLTVTEQGLGPSGIAVGADGLVYVADTWAHRVVVLDGDGRIVRAFGEYLDNVDSTDPTLNPGTFFGPRGIAVTPNEIYVTDTGNERVQVFGLDGTFLRAFGGTGAGPTQLLEPVGIAIGGNGSVYVADSGNARVSVFDAEGASTSQWPVEAWAGSAFYEPYLTASPDGLIYASSALTSSVLVFDPSGALVEQVSEVDGVPLDQPAGVAFDPTDALVIADRGLSAVIRSSSANELIPELPIDDEVIDLPVDDGPIDEPASPEASPVLSSEASPLASPVASPEASPIASPEAQPVNA